MRNLVDDSKQYNYLNVKRWTKKIDIFSLDKIFVPINITNTHWTIAVVFMQSKEIKYYDSMHGNGSKYTSSLLKWIKDDAADKKGDKDYDISVWKTSNVPEAPLQHNGYDCGVFTIVCADYLLDHLPVNEDMYGQAHMYGLIKLTICHVQWFTIIVFVFLGFIFVTKLHAIYCEANLPIR
jgi:sentrin-specific protease 1